MTALPRITDVDGELKLRVWWQGQDYVFPIGASAAANLNQDLTDACARRIRQMEKTELPTSTELI